MAEQKSGGGKEQASSRQSPYPGGASSLPAQEKSEEFKKWLKEGEVEKAIPEKYQPVEWGILRKKNLPDPEFIVKGLIPKEGITIICGDSGAGKGWLILSLACAVAKGEKWLDQFETKKTNVGIVAEEEFENEFRRRQRFFGPHFELPIFLWPTRGMMIDNEDDREWLLKMCELKKIELLIFDPLDCVHNRNENDSGQMTEVFKMAREFVKKGIGIILAQHERKEYFRQTKDKGQSLRGSTAIKAAIDSLIIVDKKYDTGKRFEQILTPEKMRLGWKRNPFRIIFDEESDKSLYSYDGEIEIEAALIEEAEKFILSILEDEIFYRQQIIDKCKASGISERTASRGLSQLLEKKKLANKSKSNKSYYCLPKHIGRLGRQLV